jgi:hypothetical protein
MRLLLLTLSATQLGIRLHRGQRELTRGEPAVRGRKEGPRSAHHGPQATSEQSGSAASGGSGCRSMNAHLPSARHPATKEAARASSEGSQPTVVGRRGRGPRIMDLKAPSQHMEQQRSRRQQVQVDEAEVTGKTTRRPT